MESRGEKESATFPDDTLKQLIKEQLMRPLAEVYPLTLEQWVEGFRRYEDPDREIAVMLVVAKTYTEFVAATALDRQQKREAFGLVHLRSKCPDSEIFLKRHHRKILSGEQAGAIAALYEKNRRGSPWHLNDDKRLSGS